MTLNLNTDVNIVIGMMRGICVCLIPCLIITLFSNLLVGVLVLMALFVPPIGILMCKVMLYRPNSDTNVLVSILCKEEAQNCGTS